MFNSIQKNKELSEEISKELGRDIPRPVLHVLTQDNDTLLFNALKNSLPFCEVRLYHKDKDEKGALLIDPAIGLSGIRANITESLEKRSVAIIRRETFSSALFLAMRMTHGRIVEDPRINLDPLKHFLTESLGLVFSIQDRRVFPRASQSGAVILSPEKTEILDISPYGACIQTSTALMDTPLLRVKLHLERPGIDIDVDTKVAAAKEVSGRAELRLCFYKVPSEVQHELMRIANAELLCRTISDTFKQCEEGELSGFRKIVRFSDINELLDYAVADKATFTFSVMHKGRPVKAVPVAVDPSRRHITVVLEHDEALGIIAGYHQFSATIRHESYLMDGYLLKTRAREAVLTFPKNLISTDIRTQERETVSPVSPIWISLSGKNHVVKDFSPRGCSFYVPEEDLPLSKNERASVMFDLGQEFSRSELIQIGSQRKKEEMVHVSAIFLDPSQEVIDTPAIPLKEETLLKEDGSIRRTEQVYPSEPVFFLSHGRRIAGLWSEIIHEGPLTVVIIPPAWAKTKESTSLLSQYVLSSFDTNGKSAAVLRIDYSNAIGESEKSEAFRKPGHDTLGLTFSACVEDIKSAVDYASERAMASRPILNMVLAGMSFSGPLCLRAAVTDKRITRLIQYMGASDIQDLVRTSTGGIDYVSRYRAGIRNSIQNVLGMLSDTDRWCRDGLDEHLVLLQESEIDAAGLGIPVVWIHGIYDAFVNEKRILSILDRVRGEKYFFKVPYGHIPTKSTDAIHSFMPAIRFLLNGAGLEDPIVSAPIDPVILSIAQKEWERAPRVKIPSLQSFWREYMTGSTEGAMGFDILSMTGGYKDLMTCQAALLEIKKEDILYDIGGGMGHVISYLADSQNPKPAAVHLYDFVSELFDIAQKRSLKHGIPIKTTQWHAEEEHSLAHFGSAHLVLMSLFLSCLKNPLSFLRKLFEALPQGARIVASTIRPDADISLEYLNLLEEIRKGTAAIPEGYTQDRFLQSVRDYMNSAAFLLRLTDEGTFHLFDKHEFIELFENAGFSVLSHVYSFGTPGRAVVIKAIKK